MDDLFDLDFTPIYRLSALGEEVITTKDERNGYEHIEELVVVHDGKLCLERYCSESGPDYVTTQHFYLFSEEETKRIISTESLAEVIMRLKREGVRAFYGYCNSVGIAGVEMMENPFKDEIDRIIDKRNDA